MPILPHPTLFNPIVETLLKALEAHDRATAEHCKRVGARTKAFAEFSGFSKQEQEVLYYSGLFHDLGKMGISPEILQKKEPLTQFERQVLRGHAAWGEHILKPLHIFPVIQKALPAIRHHHERFDGTGYPDKMSGTNIPEGARLVAIIDAVDAMTSNRSYRIQISLADAVEEIRCGGGTQFDPKWVDLYLGYIQPEIAPLKKAA